MSSLVNFEVFTPGKHFTTAREGARKRFLARVHTNVIHQFVLGFERSSIATATLPEAGVIGALGSADVFHCDMRYDFVHRVKQLVACLLRTRLVRVNPHARQFLFDWGPHVAEESAGAGVSVSRCLSSSLRGCCLVSVVSGRRVMMCRHSG